MTDSLRIQPSTRPSPLANSEIAVIEKTHPDFRHVAAIRRQVFIEEQAVPEEEEWDEMDAAAKHLLARIDGKPVGTLRFYDDGGWLRVGRVAVLPEYRAFGLGGRMVAKCLEISMEMGFSKSYLNAQSDKTGFYHKFGYREVGDEFTEAGIPHRRMELHF